MNNPKERVRAGMKRRRGDDRFHIQELEESIKMSQKNYNNIAILLKLTKDGSAEATLSLCRVFSRLIAKRMLLKTKDVSQTELALTDWLCKQYELYRRHLVDYFKRPEFETHKTAMALLMHLNKTQRDNTSGDKSSLSFSLEQPLRAVLCVSEKTSACQFFVEEYAQEHVDVKSFLIDWIKRLLSEAVTDDEMYIRRSNALTVLSSIDPPDQNTDLPIRTYFAHNWQHNPKTLRKDIKDAWLLLLKSDVHVQQRKRVLAIMQDRVIPWFNKTELLMDFLTDSYNQGGTLSLLSLSSLYHLMRENNLDYPSFYPRLYALLDAKILHSKHRSHFFRLFNTFLSSTHLPSALVASFIKRLSRLALHGPPAGIVAVIPWIYNMLRAHPTCTFMVHREPRTEDELERLDREGFSDPFNMEESDPMNTGAIDSSLWELDSLQIHWHPNVSSLAKILSQQFTKREYNLEDFLDHSYNTLIEGELGRDLKGTPVVEFDIPKTIFREGDDNTLEGLVLGLYNESS